VFEELDVDDTELPAITVVPLSATWDEVYDHIKISHAPLVVIPEGGEDYVGAWWTGSEMVKTDELGPDLDDAIVDFRQYLIDRGQL
jgi:hypothetical protein